MERVTCVAGWRRPRCSQLSRSMAILRAGVAAHHHLQVLLGRSRAFLRAGVAAHHHQYSTNQYKSSVETDKNHLPEGWRRRHECYGQ